MSPDPVSSESIASAPSTESTASAPSTDAAASAPSTAPSHPALSRDEVAHLAHLARLQLTEEELDLYGGQLSVILESVATVSAVATGEIVPTTHAVPLTNVYREDVVVPGLTQQQALSGAPAQEDGRFRVPQILGEEA